MKIRLTTLLFVTLVVTGCASVAPVELVGVSVVEKAPIGLSKSSVVNEVSRQKVPTIEFEIVSNQNLHHFFIVQEKQFPGIWCSISGKSMNEEFTSVGFGPFFNGENISKSFSYEDVPEFEVPNSDGQQFKYKIYSFLKLVAYSKIFVNGNPESKASLIDTNFDKIVCRIHGFTYPPLTPPRSTDFGINREEFERIINDYRDKIR